MFLELHTGQYCKRHRKERQPSNTFRPSRVDQKLCAGSMQGLEKNGFPSHGTNLHVARGVHSSYSSTVTPRKKVVITLIVGVLR
jgi:hypothetical protein